MDAVTNLRRVAVPHPTKPALFLLGTVVVNIASVSTRSPRQEESSARWPWEVNRDGFPENDGLRRRNRRVQENVLYADQVLNLLRQPIPRSKLRENNGRLAV